MDKFNPVSIAPRISAKRVRRVERKVTSGWNVRANSSALLIWVTSGSSLGGIGDPHITYLIYAGLQILICARPKFAPAPGVKLFICLLIYALWTFVATVLGYQGQFVGFFGLFLRIVVVILPFIFIRKSFNAVIDVMALLCWIAIPIFALRQIVLLGHYDIADAFQSFYGWLGPQADRTLIFYNFHTVGEEARNSGAFREPGMFAANIVMASMLCVIPGIGLNSQKIRRRLTLFFVALLTTRSTAGLATLPLLALIAMPYFSPRGAGRILRAPVLALIVAILIAFFGASQLDKIEGQMSGVQTHQSSWYNTRFGNFIIDLQAIKGRPVLGYGFSEDGRPMNFVVYDYHEGDSLGFGNGLSGTAVKFGIPATACLYLLFWLSITNLYKNIFKSLVVFLCLGMMLFSQQLLLLSAIYVFLFVKYPVKLSGRPAMPASRTLPTALWI